MMYVCCAIRERVLCGCECAVYEHVLQEDEGLAVLWLGPARQC